MALVADASQTAQLMMSSGDGTDLKRHAVALFESGKWTDESLASILRDIETVCCFSRNRESTVNAPVLKVQ